MWDDPYEFEDDLDDMEQYEREQLREDARLDREEAEEARREQNKNAKAHYNARVLHALERLDRILQDRDADFEWPSSDEQKNVA